MEDTDLALAIQLSQQESATLFSPTRASQPATSAVADPDSDELIARLMQEEYNRATTNVSAHTFLSEHRPSSPVDPALALANQLQAEEDERVARQMQAQEEQQRHRHYSHPGSLSARQRYSSSRHVPDLDSWTQANHDFDDDFHFSPVTRPNRRRNRQSRVMFHDDAFEDFLSHTPLAAYGMTMQPQWQHQGPNRDIEQALATGNYEELLRLDEGNVKVGVKDLEGKTGVETLTQAQVTALTSKGEVECTVCMDAMSVGDRCRRLPCLHLFHVDCIDPWLKDNHTCPVCQKSVND
eukprot:TRINITY_DN9337_c0_g1_i1.p1 TRINITY_DN9337_c0_g1~~TRINITY_DN9337_c0_g1_i1.p1  ORF type:complete len:295 (+),score=46.89 TRINITY_DN9337_c0_g1_i1:116-1000(+)